MPELERYELSEGPAYTFVSGRRDFLKLVGGGLAFLLVLDDVVPGQSLPQDIAAWLHIAGDGQITVFTGKVEVGQNIRTSLTEAVAEELHCSPQEIHMVMGDTDLVPYDMGTFGSRTTPTMAPQLRKVAAAARETLIGMAAAHWNVDRAALTVSDGRVRNGSDSLTFGQLTKGKELVQTISASTKAAQPAGQSLSKVNAHDIVTGAHKYPSDIKRPGMLYGRVLRPESFGAKLISASGPGLIRDGDFAGVVAENEGAANKALAAIKAEWKERPQPGARALFDHLKATAKDASSQKLDATYTVAYIAHTPLEPRAAVAEWNGDKLTVWTGTQRPFGVKSELAEAFGIPESKVRVIMPDTGSGYGGKHTGECAIEAARLAKAAGKPVKLVWSREEEFTWAYFRPAGVIEISSTVAKDGRITDWEFHNYNSGPSGIETPYDVANKTVKFHASDSPLRQGSYRGLAATANHFARESYMDELAAAASIDPLAFRYKNLSNPRISAVLSAAAERFGWGKSKSAGLACGMEKGGYVACCAEVSVVKGKVRIDRVVLAFECGAIVNPKHLENQAQGSVVMGIGGTLFEAIDFENGRILNPRLSKYRVPRFSDLPEIEIVLVDRKDLPSAGAGETPIVGLAPAVGNAIFRATGVRVRSLPMLPALTGLKA
jgi:isoquinoline 1-oxidoreductase